MDGYTDETKDCGLEENDKLFGDIPGNLRIKEPFALPEALGEYDLKKVMQNLAGRNISASDAACFLGAGIYDHFIPSVVNRLTEYASFCINGGGNQDACIKAVYELQIYMQKLTGMNTVNVMLNGISEALTQAAVISCRLSGKNKIIVSRAVNPEYRRLLNTYCSAYGITLGEAKCGDGTTSTDELAEVLGNDCACVIAQSPNYFGNIEEMDELAEESHKFGALFTAVTDPVSLAILKTPREYGADITVGNAQPLGGTLSYGAHYFAYFGVSEALKQYIPKGRAIKRESGGIELEKNVYGRANRLLPAFSAAAYIAAMGANGLKAVASACYSNAYYTYEKLIATSAFKPVFNKPFFREFAVKAVKKNVGDINNRMLDYGMIGGYALKNDYPELGNAWLAAVTEKRSADEVELFVKEASRSI